MRHVFYLHGFASSPTSTKAAYFADRLRARGLDLHCPDFNEPDFEHVTVTRMLAQLDDALAALPPGPVALIGSSLGGFVAFHAAARHAAARGRARTSVRPIDRLILLAPALEFGRTPFGGLSDEDMRRWRETGLHEFLHHAGNRPRAVRYALYEDARRYDSAGAAVDTPTLVFQGRRDTVVEPAMVERFGATRHAMTVRMLDDDHQLGSSLEHMWRESAAFLGLCG
jgi:hypothetical protein